MGILLGLLLLQVLKGVWQGLFVSLCQGFLSWESQLQQRQGGINSNLQAPCVCADELSGAYENQFPL